MKIVTWNINGVEARIEVLTNWLPESDPDIVCLQEIHGVEDEPSQKLMDELRRRTYADPWGRTSHGDEAGVEADFDLWTSCFTPRELRLMVVAAGLDVEHLWSVTPGAYAANPPDLDHPEWLVVARKP